MRRERKYYIKWEAFGLWMNRCTTSSTRYCRKWKLGLKYGESGAGVFCGFLANFLVNIRYSLANENALTWPNNEPHYFLLASANKRNKN